MYHKKVFCFILFSVIVPLVMGNPWVQRSQGSPASIHNPLKSVPIITLEEACVRQGGICLPLEDCQPSNRIQVHADLCPEQRHLGVECCYI